MSKTTVRVYTVTCITDKYGCYTKDKQYPVYYQDVFATKPNKNYPTTEYILDDEGDKMYLKWLRTKTKYFEISYVEVPFDPSKDYTNIWEEVHNEK